MKTCTVCNIEKDDDAFNYQRNQCKDCRKAIQRQYRKSTTKAKEWVEKNRERMTELQHNNYEKNKEQINEKYKERYANDPVFRKVRLYRASMSSFLRGLIKTNKHIGCTQPFFLKWIQSAFTVGMTMENYGTEWVLDHIIPLDKAETEEDFAIISKWFNIRPVTMKFNLVKNKYIDSDQALIHLGHLKKHATDDQHKSYKTYLAKHLVAGNPLET
jgi:hypothetical protein